MSRLRSCDNCGRPIKEGNEHALNGKYYGSECIDKQVDLMNFPSIQPEFPYNDEEAAEFYADPENRSVAGKTGYKKKLDK